MQPNKSKRLAPTWLCPFYGANFSFLELEALTVQNIPAEVSRAESGLFDKKWFDYRRLHPMQATLYFSEQYSQAYGKMLVKAFSHKMGYSRGIKGKSFLNSRERVTFWKLRQKVDAYGIRYEFFFNFAIDWHFAKGWLHIPRPSHLLSNDEMFADCILAWESLSKDVIQMAEDNWYCVSNYAGHKDQIAYQNYLIEKIKGKRHKKYALHSLMYRYDALRIETALMSVDKGDICEAINLTQF